MELLIFLLLSPAILAQRYEKSNDPNDEPFLPIFPFYPYNPKLIKRGAERETVTQLTPELYAPKVDAKDSYSTTTFSTNYARDPYYPNYVPYSSSLPYSYSSTPYNNYNSYSSPYTIGSSPYSTIPYSSPFPNYYYQPPYYYPNYYNQPVFPPPPPPPNTDYSGTTDSYDDTEPTNKSKETKSSESKKSNENDVNQETEYQYVDGGNYISGNSKDLDTQPSTYKTNSPQNQLVQLNTVHLKNLPMVVPKTTYRVISVAGHPVGPDYPLPDSYVRAQQLEELMAQTWTKMYKNSQRQGAQYAPQETNKNTGSRANDGQYTNQNDYNRDSQRYVTTPNILAKTGLAYMINPNILGKVNIGPANGQIVQTPTTLSKSVKYPSLTQVSLEQSPGAYETPEKSEKDETSVDTNDYDNYDNPSSQIGQNYDSQADSKQVQTFHSDQEQGISYQKPTFVTVQTPQPYNYQYSNYNPSHVMQHQSQQYKTNLDDVNFGAKQTNKG